MEPRPAGKVRLLVLICGGGCRAAHQRPLLSIVIAYPS
jgi:hypothetical protein